MSRHRTAVAVILGLALFSSVPSRSDGAPMRMADCEGVSGDPHLWICGGVFTFTGNSGKATWPNNGTADLNIERFDDEQVVIRRTDTGLSLGATAVYTGTRSGYRIEGQVVYTWPEKWPESKTGVFSATIENGADYVSGAARGSFADVSGIWELKPDNPDAPVLLAVTQEGADVNTVLILNGRPVSLVYRGRFSSSSAISGHLCGSSEDRDHPYCALESSVTKVLDANHVQNSLGNVFERIAGRDDPRYAQALPLVPARNAKRNLPEAPFQLTGTWQASTQSGAGGRMEIKQANGLLNIGNAFLPYPFFTGWYSHNSAIGGTRLSRTGTSPTGLWASQTMFVDSPDTIHVISEEDAYELFRVSLPAAHDVPCDPANPARVKPYYAWVRGSAALKAQDERTARCWLTLSSNLGWPAGQSLLAAVMMNATPPDYEAAFQWATKSAAQGDIMGQIELASLYRDGKGTAQDAAKAQYWQAHAEQAQEAAKWRAFNAKNAAVDAMGRLLLAWFAMHIGDESEEQEAAYEEGQRRADQTKTIHRNIQCNLYGRC